MDLILKFYDDKVLTPYIYPSTWNEDWWIRQYLSLFIIVTVHSYLIYLLMSGVVYFLVFDKQLTKHPKYLKVH
jgi:Delta7-sterol 5-desaturase